MKARMSGRKLLRARSGRRRACAVAVALLVLLNLAAAHGDEAPAAKIVVSSSTSGSSLGGRLVEGRMSFRGHEYLLRMEGVAETATTTGSVYGLLRPRDVAGVFEPVGDGLRNSSGVTIRFDPPLRLAGGKLVVEVASRIQPKLSGGAHESGVE
jgi:hypothetical protein